MVNFKENYYFKGFQRGSNIFQGGGSNNFSRGGGPTTFPGGGGWGSNCLFPIETHIICDFPGGGGGSGHPVPPLDPHLVLMIKAVGTRRRIDKQGKTSQSTCAYPQLFVGGGHNNKKKVLTFYFFVSPHHFLQFTEGVQLYIA